jgi:hypothetical protein
MASLSVAPGISVQCLESVGCSCGGSPWLLLAVEELPLHAGAGVRALEVADKDSTQIRLVADHAAGQVLESRPCGVAEVEWQVHDDEEVIRHSTHVAREPLVLQPHTGVHLPIESKDFCRGLEDRGKSRIPHVLTKGLQAPLVQ